MIAASTTTLPVAWLIARAAGLVAFALLTAAVTLGLLLSTRILGTRRGKMLMEWHQALIWTSVSMLALHGAALLLDPTLKFGPLAVLVPGTAPWRPLPVAAGIVTGWLMLTLAVSFRFRRQIGQRRWRMLHYASFVAFSAGLWHALNTGSDLVGARGLLFALVVLAPVLWLTFVRVLTPRPPARRPASRNVKPTLASAIDATTDSKPHGEPVPT